ncbi:Multidrug resistance-associated protein 4 [Trachymyrmex septentrionalis]|uniref:Multidrug resistance-associated protein 4 n=1 Tax=Trachymyrmex septentrionalis TaxID=34720 RepID=A0A151JV81_9HYME|nr:Multidrug resistance-associated protein 4 [Trachymyrmex septentrionalis]
MNQTGTGQIMNLLSNDVIRFDQLTMYLNYIWIMPFMTTIIGTMMLQKVGISCLVGIGTLLIIVLPGQETLSFLNLKLRTMIAPLTLGNNLTVDVTYEMSTYFNILQLVVALYFPQGLILLGKSIVSFNRLEIYVIILFSNARHLYGKYITEYLHGKTRILVTHQLQFLQRADHIVVLDRGFVKLQGNYNELVQLIKDFFGMLDNLNQAQRKEEDMRRVSEMSKKITITRQISRLSTTSSIAIFILNPDGLLSIMDAIHIYTFCIIACITTTLFRSFLYMKVSMNTSSNLHNIMFFKLLQARMSFLHNNPSGRILNRFSKDMGIMDEWLSKLMLEAIQGFCVVCSIMTMEAIINQWMLILIATLVILFFFATKSYMKIGQDLKRLEGFSESVSLMTSVERILQYTNLPKKEPITSDNPPPLTWPSQGQLILKDVNMKYHMDDSPVLKYDDLKLWEVLRQVEARAILRNNRLLVLNETNIDSHTDALIEFGWPHEMLHDKPNGYFSQTVEKTSNQNGAKSFRTGEEGLREE